MKNGLISKDNNQTWKLEPKIKQYIFKMKNVLGSKIKSNIIEIREISRNYCTESDVIYWTEHSFFI